MRLSVDPNDPGFDLEKSVRAKIFFNGVQINNAITADEEKRLVVRYVLDEAGRIKDPTVTTLEFGHVRVEVE